MKAKYLKYALVGVISLFNLTSTAEHISNQNSSIEASKEVLSAIRPVNQIVATAGVNPIITGQTTILVPFNLNLYQEYHDKKTTTSKNNIAGKLTTIITYAIIVGSGLLCVVDPVMFGTWKSTFLASRWYSKIYNIFYHGITATSFVGSLWYASTTISNDFKNYITWKDKDVLASSIKQTLWHKEIYEKLGNPIVEGTAPTSGTYYIIGEKKHGAGKVIFDPFDLNQVKILLGIHDTITENLQCTKITIVPTVSFK